MKDQKWTRFIYRTKEGTEFRFNEEGDYLNEVTVIAQNSTKAFNILKNSYPHFKKSEVFLYKREVLEHFFK